MDHVVAEDQRDAEARLGDGDVLRVSRRGRPGQVQEAADQALTHEVQLLGGRLIVHRELIQLAELLLQGHAGEEGVDVSDWGGSLGREGRRDAAAQGERDDDAQGVVRAHRGHGNRRVEGLISSVPIYAIVVPLVDTVLA